MQSQRRGVQYQVDRARGRIAGLDVELGMACEDFGRQGVGGGGGPIHEMQRTRCFGGESQSGDPPGASGTEEHNARPTRFESEVLAQGSYDGFRIGIEPDRPNRIRDVCGKAGERLPGAPWTLRFKAHGVDGSPGPGGVVEVIVLKCL